MTRRVGWAVLDTLVIEEDGAQCQAVLTSPHTNALPALERGSILQLTGICDAEVGEWKTVRNLTLLLRDADDVRVVGRAWPWATWNAGRILAGAGALGVAALAWIWLLRRRVRQRTDELELAKEELRHALAQEKELG